jgi:hypothetical protein
MINDIQENTSGRPNYEQNITVPMETIPASKGQKFEDKTAVSYDAEDVAKYYVNRPTRDIIYAKIVRQESRKKPCIISEETKTTE